MARTSICLPVAISIFYDLKEGNNKQFIFEAIKRMNQTISNKRFRLMQLCEVAEKFNLKEDLDHALDQLADEEEYVNNFLEDNKKYEKPYRLSANQLISELERLKKEK